MIRAKTAEPIEVPFRMWTRVRCRVNIPAHERAILRAKKSRPRTCPTVDIGLLKVTQRGGEGRELASYGAHADLGVLE